MDLTTRVSLVQNLLTTKEIPASVGAKLLNINRTSIYYNGSNVSDEELACKEIIDHLHTDNPAWGIVTAAPGHLHKAGGTDFSDCQDLSPDTAVPD